MARPNENVIRVIKGYNVLRGRTKGSVFLQSPEIVNFSFPIRVLNTVANLIRTNPNFRANFYDKRVIFPLMQVTSVGGRPNERVLVVIEGYQFFKARELGYVFIQSPQGVCFTLDIDVLLTLQEDLNNPQFYALFN